MFFIRNKYFHFAFFAVCLILLSNYFVIKREINIPINPFVYVSDAETYVNMSNGFWEQSPAPFKYRVLLPFLVSISPFETLISFIFFTYVSLFITYIIIFKILNEFIIDTKFIYIGFLLIWTSTWHQYYFHNPFLTDSLANMFLCFMFYFFLKDSFILFSIFSILAILTRESCLFLIPIYFFKPQKLRTFFLMIFSIFVLLIIRLILFSKGDTNSLFNLVLEIKNHLHNPISLIIDIIKSWGFIWIFSFLGIFSFSNKEIKNIYIIFLFTFLTSLFTSLIATDTGRMFSILMPILTIFTCSFLESFYHNHKFNIYIFVFLLVSQYLISMKNIFLSYFFSIEQIFYIKILFMLISMLIIYFILRIYYRTFYKNFICKLNFLKNSVKNFYINNLTKYHIN